MARQVDPIRDNTPIASKEGNATGFFVRQWNNLLALVGDIQAATAAAAAAAADAAVAAAAALAAQTTANAARALTSAHIFVGNGSNVATDVALSGDATIGNTGILALANTAVTPGVYGDSTHVAQVTVDAKGRVTLAANVAIATAGTSAALSAAILALSPTSYWKCDDTGNVTLVDSGSSGTNLTLAGTRTVAFSSLLPGESTPYIKFGTNGNARKAASTMGITPPFSSNWSWFGILNHINTGGVSGTIFNVEGNGETAVLNRQIGVGRNSADNQTENHESGAGVDNATTNAAAGGGGSVACGRAQAWGLVCDNTAKEMSYYLNGRLIGVSAFTNVATGGTDATVSTGIGAGPETTTSTVMVVGHVAFFYGTKLTAAQQLALATAAGLNQ